MGNFNSLPQHHFVGCLTEKDTPGEEPWHSRDHGRFQGSQSRRHLKLTREICNRVSLTVPVYQGRVHTSRIWSCCGCDPSASIPNIYPRCQKVRRHHCGLPPYFRDTRQRLFFISHEKKRKIGVILTHKESYLCVKPMAIFHRRRIHHLFEVQAGVFDILAHLDGVHHLEAKLLANTHIYDAYGGIQSLLAFSACPGGETSNPWRAS